MPPVPNPSCLRSRKISIRSAQIEFHVGIREASSCSTDPVPVGGRGIRPPPPREQRARTVCNRFRDVPGRGGGRSAGCRQGHPQARIATAQLWIVTLMSRKDACSRGLSSTMTEKVFLGKEKNRAAHANCNGQVLIWGLSAPLQARVVREGRGRHRFAGPSEFEEYPGS